MGKRFPGKTGKFLSDTGPKSELEKQTSSVRVLDESKCNFELKPFETLISEKKRKKNLDGIDSDLI